MKTPLIFGTTKIAINDDGVFLEQMNVHSYQWHVWEGREETKEFTTPWGRFEITMSFKKVGEIEVVEAPGDRCGNTKKLPDGSKCPGCRACQ